jgi:acetyl-CoA carboxylase carboxyl transferase subunit alpha
MAMNFLDFEAPIAELEAKIDELKFVSSDAEVNIADEIARLRAKSRQLTTSIFSNLTQWQIAQLARHPQRPYTLDYVASIFTDFQELHGDRMYSDDHAIVGGPARLDGKPVMVIGQQKGRDTKERVRRNYGMPKPEGYRKALRLMHMAERFQMPLFTFIDTSGAYPGVGAEERGQSEAIARNLFEMSRLQTPIIATVIGEGGSGGALALGVADRVNMMENSVYSVISVEGAAAILWKDGKLENRERAASALRITAPDLFELRVIDEIIPEPSGGAHSDHIGAAKALQETLLRQLDELRGLKPDKLVRRRREKYLRMGQFTE